MRDHVIAVDVGTGSARAGLVDRAGKLLARCEHPILMRRADAEQAEHASEDIWAACCKAVRMALAEAGMDSARIAAIGFDATCSLVLRDANGAPLPLAKEAETAFDTIAWMDHRAGSEAEECTATGHEAIKHSGRIMSPEMQMPKLMWLKRNRPDLWQRAGYIFDLADFLTWKATGTTSRSRCTLTAKWNFLAHKPSGWQDDFLAEIGLEDLKRRGSLPDDTVAVGRPIATLCGNAAEALGLDTDVVVAAGMIDAYAGALGVLGNAAGDPRQLDGQVAMIGGTSSCIIGFAAEPHHGTSIWGPYFEAVFADLWLVEAGQSATGGLLGHLLELHSAGGGSAVANHRAVIARIQELRNEQGDEFANGIHILPDFHGNRSPFADPNLTGVISGLTLDTSFDGLCRIYWRACVAIVLGLKQILDTLEKAGFSCDCLHLTGGHVKNPLLVELYADVTGIDVVIPQSDDAVLLGTAINAAAAAGLYPSLTAAGSAMGPKGQRRAPNPETARLYQRDYARFLAMQRHRAELNSI